MQKTLPVEDPVLSVHCNVKIASFLSQDCTGNPEDPTCEGSRHEHAELRVTLKK